VGSRSTDYQPRIASQTVVHQVVRDHFETFRAHAAGVRNGEGLPRFVEEEFREFLGCGCLAGGFARFRCGDCGLDRLVPFSCKARACCASCGGRRMAERAAHLVDHVFPTVPVRQWVLTLPHFLRYRLAWDHDLCRNLVGVAMRAVLGFLRHAAREAGIEDGRGGAVALIQRFGGALNLNVHVHALVIDGVFTRDGAGVRFWPAPSLTDIDVAEVLATIVPRIPRLLGRKGLGADDGDAVGVDEWEAEEPVLAGLAAASVQGRFALGSRAGRGVRRCGVARDPADPPTPTRDHARQDGFDLHAGVRVSAHDRDRLERLCRYVLRPPVAQDRLRLTPEGQVLLELKRPWSDGTSQLLFDPVEFLERLAVLIPRPRINLILYHGVLGPRAAWRPLVVRLGRCAPRVETATTVSGASDTSSSRLDTRLWAVLMRRTFGIDTLACPRCGGRLRLIALIEDAAVIERILRHLGLPTESPAPQPGRAPPLFVSASREADSGIPVLLPCH
jgi:Putative transposase/Transposase zinc-binding domain